MSSRAMELDPVLYALKPSGLYQAGQTLLFFIGYFSCAYPLFAVVFTGQKVEYLCASPDNGSLHITTDYNDSVDKHNGPQNQRTSMAISSDIHYDQCSIVTRKNVSGDVVRTETPCLFGMQYDHRRDFSFISEFDLVCKLSSLKSLSQTLLMLGQGIGAVAFTALSDRFGRKRIQVITHVLLTAGGLVLAFAPNYVIFAIFKLLVGAVQQGVILTTVTANVESFPGRYRGLVAGILASFWWAFVSASFSLWGYFFRDYSWRVLQAAMAATGLLVIPQIIFLREPLRWLLANGRREEVVEQLKQAARVNKSDVNTVLEAFHRLTSGEMVVNGSDHQSAANRRLSDSRQSTAMSVADGLKPMTCVVTKTTESQAITRVMTENIADRTEKLGFRDLLKHPILRKNSLCLWAIWFTNSLTFFALILMSGSLTGNIYLGFFLNVAVEIPAALIFVASIERIGRKGTLLVCHGLAAVSLLASGILLAFNELPGLQTAATVMSLLGKMSISGSFNCVFFYTPEIFPTNIRNLAIGTGSTAARVGGMISPFIGDLQALVVWAPGAIFGVCNLLVLLLVRGLPESMGRELPQTVRDLESWYTPAPGQPQQKDQLRPV